MTCIFEECRRLVEVTKNAARGLGKDRVHEENKHIG
jgi:hypothetical protein